MITTNDIKIKNLKLVSLQKIQVNLLEKEYN